MTAEPCPQCGHREERGAECSACGVVFERLVRRKPRRARAAPATRRPVARHRWPLPLLALTAVILALLLARGWLAHRTGPATPVATAQPAARPSSSPTAASGREAPVQPVESRAEPETQGAEGTGSAPPPATATPPPARPAGASRPSISPETITAELLRELERRYRDDPQDAERLRDLVSGYAAYGERVRREGDLDGAVTHLELAVRLDPRFDDALLLLAATQLARHQPDEARRALRGVSARARGSYEYHALDGELHYAKEDLEGALAAYRQAYALRPSADLAERVERLEREVGAGTNRALSSRRFQVHFEGAANIPVARLVLDALEEALNDLERTFGVDGRGVPAILYSGQDYRVVTGAPDWAAGLYDGKIRLPVGGLRRVDTRFAQVIRHELVHALVARKAGPEVPRWLHEGLAQHYEGRTLGDFDLEPSERALIGEARLLQDPRLFYAQALLLTEFLLTEYGERRLMSALDNMGDGMSFEEALRRATRTRPENLLEKYQEWAAAHPGSRSRRR